MQFNLNKFMGINEAVIDLPTGCTLVAGANGAGKTSLLRGLVACATQQPIPVSSITGKGLVTKNNAGELVHKQGKSGSATLTWTPGEPKQGTTRITWPSNGVKQGGPQASLMAGGAFLWMKRLTLDRMGLLNRLATTMEMELQPTGDDLSRAVPMVPVLMVNMAWQRILEKGWDETWKLIDAKWSETTGAWRGITGEGYGERKAELWLPAGWNDDLFVMTKAELETALELAGQAVVAALQKSAVSRHEFQRLETQAAQPRPELGTLELAEYAALKPCPKVAALMEQRNLLALTPSALSELIGKKALEDQGVKALLEKLRQSQAETALKPNGECPACKATLWITHPTPGSPRLALAVVVSEDLLAQQQAWRLQMDAELDQARAGLHALETQIGDERQKHETALKQVNDALAMARDAHYQISQEARKALKTAQGQTEGINLAQQQLEAAHNKNGSAVSAEEQERLQDAERVARIRLGAWESKKKADKEALAASNLFDLRQAVHPEGVRKAKMAETLEVFNRLLLEVSAELQWSPVSLDAELDFQMGTRPFDQLSTAEQFRCGVVMQLLFAHWDGSEVVVVDGADVLDGPSRAGLVFYAEEREIAIVLGLTAKRDYAEQIAQKVSSAWWIEDGRAVALKTPS